MWTVAITVNRESSFTEYDLRYVNVTQDEALAKIAAAMAIRDKTSLVVVISGHD